MKPRAPRAPVLLTRSVREIIAPLAPEFARLNEQAAIIAATATRINIGETEGRERLCRANEAQIALQRLEQQLEGALIGQPIEIADHDRIRDVRAAIAAIRARLREFGA
jgi:hypothetical protein